MKVSDYQSSAWLCPADLPVGIKDFENRLLDQIPGLQSDKPSLPFGKKAEMSPVEKFFKPNDPQVGATSSAGDCRKVLTIDPVFVSRNEYSSYTEVLTNCLLTQIAASR